MALVKRRRARRVTLPAVEPQGWLPPEAATPLPTAARQLLVDIELHEDDGGFILSHVATDGSASAGSWHASLADAEAAAAQQFGIGPEEWDHDG